MKEEGKENSIANHWNRIPKGLRDILRDGVVAFAIVATILLVLYAILGVWPPMVVVETGSMEHDDDHSMLGVIDTGDMVFISDVDSKSDIVTYVHGRASGHKAFGDYGDVVVYKKWGMEEHTPVIHRAMAYAEYSETTQSFTVSGLEKLEYGTDYRIEGPGDVGDLHSSRLILLDVGFKHIDVIIDFNVLENAANPHSGYLTMGDANSPAIDQISGGIINETVKLSWIIGKGEVELPWFGLIKLTFQNMASGRGLPPGVATNSWWSISIALVLIITLPFALDIVVGEVAKHIRKRKGEEEEDEPGDDDEAGPALSHDVDVDADADMNADGHEDESTLLEPKEENVDSEEKTEGVEQN